MIKKVVGKAIYFYDDDNSEIMHIDYSTDECVWYFCSDKVIEITPQMEFYQLLSNYMENMYIFGNGGLPNYKDNNKLIWFSDCYYDPDDEWSVSSVSCLNIERSVEGFNIWCTKKLDELINRADKSFCVCFSPLGNGQYSRNLNTGLTLQDDFVTSIYHPLLSQNKKLCLVNDKLNN